MKKKLKSKFNYLLLIIITIIVLLILAGVSLNAVIGENGILNRAQESKEKFNEATIEENIEMAVISALTDKSDDISKENLERELLFGFQ